MFSKYLLPIIPPRSTLPHPMTCGSAMGLVLANGKEADMTQVGIEMPCTMALSFFALLPLPGEELSRAFCCPFSLSLGMNIRADLGAKPGSPEAQSRGTQSSPEGPATLQKCQRESVMWLEATQFWGVVCYTAMADQYKSLLCARVQDM